MYKLTGAQGTPEGIDMMIVVGGFNSSNTSHLQARQPDPASHAPWACAGLPQQQAVKPSSARRPRALRERAKIPAVVACSPCPPAALRFPGEPCWPGKVRACDGPGAAAKLPPLLLRVLCRRSAR